MDKLFTYEPAKMLKKLKAIEPEMCEDSFDDETYGLADVSENALAYISAIFIYMKNTWNAEECTVLALMKTLYRIALTGEYSFLQDIDSISYTDDVFEQMWQYSGKNEVVYAGKLLRYYYLVKEKRYHPIAIWREIERTEKKLNLIATPGKIQKKKINSEPEEDMTEMEFMSACRAHMDKYYVGQETLKKKICSVITQWKYYDVRTVLLMIGPSGSGKNYLIETIRSFPELKIPVISYDCSALTPNGFDGDNVRAIFNKVKQVMRISRARNWEIGENKSNTSEKCIVYLDEIDKIISSNHDSHNENVNAMVQQQLLSALAGTDTIDGVDTSKVLFILGGAFPRIDDLKTQKSRNPLGFNAFERCTIDINETVRDQMIAIGGEIEFIGRIEDIVQLRKLTRDDLKTILMDEHIGAFTKKKKLYNASGLDLVIEEDTVEAIIDLIVKENAGARSVKNIMNQLADSEYFYDMKVGGYSCMKIHKGMLQGEAPIFIKGGNEHIEKHARYA